MEHLWVFAKIIWNPLLKTFIIRLVGEGKNFDYEILVGQFS